MVIPFVQIIVVLLIVGVILWLINTYVPMQPPFKTIVNVIVIVLLCVWLLSIVGLLGPGIGIRVR